MKKIEEYAEALVAHARRYGHSDARVIQYDARGVVVHAGKIDGWHPCGSNERYTLRDFQEMEKSCPEIFGAFRGLSPRET